MSRIVPIIAIIIVLLIVNAILTASRLVVVLLLLLLLLLLLVLHLMLIGFLAWDDDGVGRRDRCHRLIVRTVIVPLLLATDAPLHVEVGHGSVALRLLHRVCGVGDLLLVLRL